LKHANRGTAHLYIVNPIKKFENLSATMFASHPPIKDRIRRLALISHEPGTHAQVGPQRPGSEA
jgi:Zn-dependent protease with chaperone function